MLRRLARHLMRGLARLAYWPLALLILFEEWGWEPLQQGLARLGQRLGLSAIADRIRRLPPYPALALFLLPSLLLLPAKVLALWLIGRGSVLLGAIVIVCAKVVGTAVLARLFTLTQPALMQLPWFASLYRRWTAWKQSVLAQVRLSRPWRWSRVAARSVRRYWKRGRHG